MSAGPAARCNSTSQGSDSPWLHVRREPFTYGLLPLHSLMHTEGVPAFRSLRTKLLERAIACQNWPSLNNPPILSSNLRSCPATANQQPPQKRISTAGIAGSLGLPEAHAHLVLDTLASVLPDEGGRELDPLAHAAASEVDAVGADVDQLLLFLYIQAYRRVPPRAHRDAATVADVWPSSSVFDGLLPSLSPIQTRPVSHSRRWMPGQAEEEAHQLLFLQKHLPSLLALLADTEDAEVEDKVITAEKFKHLEFLLQARDAGLDILPLTQAAPFFANSDPDMPAAAVPVGQALDWILRHVCSPSVHVKDKLLAKENGVELGSSETDVTMLDAYSTSSGSASATRSGLTMRDPFQLSKEPRLGGFTVVEGVTRASFLKEEADLHGDAAIVSHCHDSVIYLLAPLKYASVFGCSDSIIVLGPTGKAVRVENCERVQLIVPSARICIANCRECLFYLGVNQRPLVLGDNHNLQVAPYNTFYPSLEAHLAQVGVDPTVNRWDRILTLGVVDPHDSVSHPAGIADVKAEGASLLQPERFLNFMVPRWCDLDLEQKLLTRANPFLLPKPYLLAQQHRAKSVETLRQALRCAPLDDIKKRDLSNVIHSYFREWLYASGSIRQIYDLQIWDKDVKGME